MDPTMPHRSSRLYAPGIDYFVCISIQATVDENLANPNAVQVTKDIAEIVEIAWAIVDANTLILEYTDSIHVRPQLTPLTQFCTALTKITWDMLENAGTLSDALENLNTCLQNHILLKKKTFSFVSHGSWDLRIQLPREARDKGIQLPSHLARVCMFDIKREAERYLSHHPEQSINNYSLSSMCSSFDIELVGPQHSGLNDVLTIVNLLRFFCSAGYSDVFTVPIDHQADYSIFLRERSKVIHLASLPYELTQSQLEAWFSMYGAHPQTLLVMTDPEGQKAKGSGFAIFETHEEANAFLDLNGRLLLDRVVEVNPSSPRVLEAASGLLCPFPSHSFQSSKGSIRPGDWICNNCGFSNFQRRTECLKCGIPSNIPPPAHLQNQPNDKMSLYNTSLSTMQTGRMNSISLPVGTITTQEFRKGDWICPVRGCGYHNFARNSRCMQCGNPKTQLPSPIMPTSISPQSATFGGSPTGFGRLMGMSSNSNTTSPVEIVGMPGNFGIGNMTTGFFQSKSSNNNPMTFDRPCSCGFVNWRRRTSCLRCGGITGMNLTTPVSTEISTFSMTVDTSIPAGRVGGIGIGQFSPPSSSLYPPTSASSTFSPTLSFSPYSDNSPLSGMSGISGGTSSVATGTVIGTSFDPFRDYPPMTSSSVTGYSPTSSI